MLTPCQCSEGFVCTRCARLYLGPSDEPCIRENLLNLSTFHSGSAAQAEELVWHVEGRSAVCGDCHFSLEAVDPAYFEKWSTFLQLILRPKCGKKPADDNLTSEYAFVILCSFAEVSLTQLFPEDLDESQSSSKVRSISFSRLRTDEILAAAPFSGCTSYLIPLVQLLCKPDMSSASRTRISCCRGSLWSRDELDVE
jgi:hypothetical protein